LLSLGYSFFIKLNSTLSNAISEFINKVVINSFMADFDSFVHGRLPYDNIKPDPTLRHLLFSLPIRKMVRKFYTNNLNALYLQPIQD
jgi:hypothetical protein